MRITARLLIIALLAVAAYLPTAIGQKPGSVNVRPRLTTTKPGVPEVRVAVDRKRVPLGDEVTFTLSPDSVVMNSNYRVTLYFGDGAHQLMRQAEIVHLYRKPGDYTYSILVEPSGSPAPTPKPAPAPAPALGVKLSAIPTSVEINRPVDFAAQLSQNYPNIKYRFVFADGSQIGWQSESKATHAYRLAGTYQAYVDIGVGSNGSVKQVGGSLRQAIKVTQPSPPSRIAVKLSASSTSVDVGSRVTFTARVDSNEPNIQYSFDFGDRSATLDWQASPRIRHKYSSPGTYPARVDARPINRRPGAQTASSSPLPIEVKATTSDTKPAVDLTVIPQSTLEGLPVFFSAAAMPPNSKTQYRFNFGDGTPPAWTEDSNQTHTYKLAGNYPAFVEISSSSNEPIKALASSDKKRVRVTRLPIQVENPTPTPPRESSPTRNTNSPGNSNSTTNSNSTGNSNSTVGPGTTTPTPSPIPSASETPSPTPPPAGGPTDDWWKYVIIAAIILFAGYQASAYFFPPRPTFVPHVDPGDSKVEAGKPFAIDYRMDLDPNLTGGEAKIDTQGRSFIKSERSSDD